MNGAVFTTFHHIKILKIQALKNSRECPRKRCAQLWCPEVSLPAAGLASLVLAVAVPWPCDVATLSVGYTLGFIVTHQEN